MRHVVDGGRAKRILRSGGLALLGVLTALSPCRLLAEAGFFQAVYATGEDVATGDPMADGIRVDAAGLTLQGNSYTAGDATYRVGDNTTAAYRTYWKMKAGVTYRFVKNYDDTGRITITDLDGAATEVLHDTVWSAVSYATYTPQRDGWHLLDLRVGNGGGGVGPTASPFNAAAKLGAGLAWTTAEGVTDCTDANYMAWNRFENKEGEPPLFQTSPAVIPMRVSYDEANGRANVGVVLDELPSATARVTVEYPAAEGVQTLVLAESATASPEPLTAEVPLLPGATSRLVVRVVMGAEEASSVFFVYAGKVSVAAGQDGDLNLGKKGTFIFSRGDSASATAEPLVVNYTLGGTAEAGADFVALSGSATIPAGESSVTVEVSPNGGAEARTLAFILAEGLYGIAPGAGAATIELVALTGGWAYDAEAGTLSGDGWVLGVQPDTSRLPNGLAVTSLVFRAGSATVLDFAKSAADAAGGEFLVVRVGDNGVFKDVVDLAELRLPEGFYSFGWEAFCGCTSLRKVEPLFPDSVTGFGHAAFQNCPIEGDMRLGFGERDVEIAWYYNFAGNRFSTVALGPKCRGLGSHGAFLNSKALKQVTLSDQCESFCPSAFEGCGAVTNFTPCLPKGLKSLNRSALRGLASCTGTLEICNGDNSYDLPDGCFSGSGFEKVVFGAKFSGRIGQNNIFREMPNLRHIHILGDANLDFALENQGHNIFDDTPYRIVVHVPAPEENASWAAVLGDSAQVAPWASLDAETKAKFRENFPGERRPKGLIVADWSSTGAQGATRTLVNRWISYESESRFIILLR